MNFKLVTYSVSNNYLFIFDLIVQSLLKSQKASSTSPGTSSPRPCKHITSPQSTICRKTYKLSTHLHHTMTNSLLPHTTAVCLLVPHPPRTTTSPYIRIVDTYPIPCIVCWLVPRPSVP